MNGRLFCALEVYLSNTKSQFLLSTYTRYDIQDYENKKKDAGTAITNMNECILTRAEQLATASFQNWTLFNSHDESQLGKFELPNLPPRT